MGKRFGTAALGAALLIPGIVYGEAGVPFDSGPDAGTDTGTTPDTGPMMDGGEPPFCEGLTAEAVCEGDTRAYCDEALQIAVREDCTMRFSGGRCVLIEAADGSDCAAPEGAACLEQQGNALVQVFCQGSNAGCIETPQGATCATNVGTCSGQQQDRCEGDRLVTGCHVNQPYMLDCTAFGGSCDASVSACVGLSSGVFCDGLTLRCRDGLVCGPLGLCVESTSSQPDAGGSASADASTNNGGGPGGDDSSCRAVAMSDSALGLGVVMLGMAFARRRRR